LASSELGQYSCIKLLQEMEALESDIEDETSNMQEDVEMINLLEQLCMELTEQRKMTTLPKDVYTIPDMMEVCQVQGRDNGEEVSLKPQNREGKDKWGPLLMEKRLTRFQKDDMSKWFTTLPSKLLQEQPTKVHY
jgi:hypothetical protein